MLGGRLVVSPFYPVLCLGFGSYFDSMLSGNSYLARLRATECKPIVGYLCYAHLLEVAPIKVWICFVCAGARASELASTFGAFFWTYVCVEYFLLLQLRPSRYLTASDRAIH